MKVTQIEVTKDNMWSLVKRDDLFVIQYKKTTPNAIQLKKLYETTPLYRVVGILTGESAVVQIEK